ncbi:MAG: recombinase family protein, partial [Clostridia bacterium]|nr:recombinase family protein [Clostridia bacterium]
MSGAKITALYCRLSQEDERLGESLSIEHQKEILLQYAKEHHYPNLTFFVDDGYSGTNFERPAFKRLLAEIEAGHVGILLTKDLSRLGRNQAMLGLYQNFTFPDNDVRYIAINDNIDSDDPESLNNDVAGIKNWVNEYYARDTSRKIRAVNKAKGEKGVPLTTNVPYGYMRDPADPKHWIIDSEAAQVVRHIYDLCMEGRGPSQIADQLNAEKVLTPAAHKSRMGINVPNPIPENPCHWNSAEVVHILEMPEYTGCVVNFKTYTKSIWDKKTRDNPKEKWAIFPGHHEVIIEMDVFQRVQEIRQQRHRRTSSGKSSIFSGLIFCEDCKEKLYFCSSKTFQPNQEFFECSTHRKNKEKCKGHFIRVVVLEEVVLAHVQMVTSYILRFEDYFRQVMTAQKRQASKEAIQIRKKELDRDERRISELKRLFIKVYEDNAAGRLSDERYEMLSQTYEAEQKQLEADTARLRQEIEVQEAENDHLER